MTGIKQRLAEMLAAHQEADCYPFDAECSCGYQLGADEPWPAHVADYIVETLSLTRQTDGDSHRWTTDWQAGND